jgi:hypothetical protein
MPRGKHNNVCSGSYERKWNIRDGLDAEIVQCSECDRKLMGRKVKWHNEEKGFDSIVPRHKRFFIAGTLQSDLI